MTAAAVGSKGWGGPCFFSSVFRRALTAASSLSGSWFWTLVAALAVIPGALEIACFHPYETSAFNPLVGSFARAAERYKVDYWGTALRAGIEWIDHHARPRPGEAKINVVLGVFSTLPRDGVAFFASDRVRIVSLAELAGPLRGQDFSADYYLAPRRDGMDRRFPEADVAHAVMLEGVPLAVVRDLHGAVVNLGAWSAP